jgi:hypothetical protein
VTQDIEEGVDEGISRRSALKRIAAVGGAAWVVPAVQTLNMPKANAQTAGGSPRTVCYCVKWDPSQTPPCSEGPGQCNVCTPDSVEGGCSPQRFTVTQNADGTWTVTLNEGCTFLEGHAVSKCARDLCEPAVPNPADTGATFVPCPEVDDPTHEHDISHIEFVYCCETTE